MTKTLESPLEALALNYLSYGFFLAVNSIWAWIAVVTAALSFWRIRASSSSRPIDTSIDIASQSTTSPPGENCGKREEVKLVALSAAVSGGVQEGEGSRKTKFRRYYKEDDFRRENDEDGEAEADAGITAAAAAVLRGKLGRLCDDWERMMAVRMGDLGWYRWVDTAALDGSVVRLWDAPPRTVAGM